MSKLLVDTFFEIERVYKIRNKLSLLPSTKFNSARRIFNHPYKANIVSKLNGEELEKLNFLECISELSEVRSKFRNWISVSGGGYVFREYIIVDLIRKVITLFKFLLNNKIVDNQYYEIIKESKDNLETQIVIYELTK